MRENLIKNKGTKTTFDKVMRFGLAYGIALVALAALLIFLLYFCLSGWGKCKFGEVVYFRGEDHEDCFSLGEKVDSDTSERN